MSVPITHQRSSGGVFGSVLSFLGSNTSKSFGVRMERNGERYPAARNTAEISWGDSDSGKTIPAQVLNISMNGLFLQTNPSPPKDLESVRVRMIQPHESEWMPGKIVRRSGKYRLGVALESAMSYDLFRTFLEGCDLFVKDAPEALDEVDGHFWR